MSGPGERPVRLSAHHALCVHGFRGMGYSAPFVARMHEITAGLRARPATPVVLTVGADAACAACPSLTPGGCARYGRRVAEQDVRVAGRLGLPLGVPLAWARVQERVRARVAPDDLPGLCGGCPWLGHGVCAAGLADLAAGRPTPAGPDGPHPPGGHPPAGHPLL